MQPVQVRSAEQRSCHRRDPATRPRDFRITQPHFRTGCRRAPAPGTSQPQQPTSRNSARQPLSPAHYPGPHKSTGIAERPRRERPGTDQQSAFQDEPAVDGQTFSTRPQHRLEASHPTRYIPTPRSTPNQAFAESVPLLPRAHRFVRADSRPYSPSSQRSASARRITAGQPVFHSRCGSRVPSGPHVHVHDCLQTRPCVAPEPHGCDD
mgnify:FL=1